MSKEVESWLSQLERESDALKQSFQQSATSVNFIMQEISYTTQRNPLTITNQWGTNTTNGPERTIITFSTSSGANTVVKIEMTSSQTLAPLVRMVPKSGGAQFMITNNPDTDSGGNWRATNYTFRVYSFIDGSLSVRPATS